MLLPINRIGHDTFVAIASRVALTWLSCGLLLAAVNLILCPKVEIMVTPWRPDTLKRHTAGKGAKHTQWGGGRLLIARACLFLPACRSMLWPAKSPVRHTHTHTHTDWLTDWLTLDNRKKWNRNKFSLKQIASLNGGKSGGFTREQKPLPVWLILLPFRAQQRQPVVLFSPAASVQWNKKLSRSACARICVAFFWFTSFNIIRHQSAGCSWGPLCEHVSVLLSTFFSF